jgi:rfaE bifunctional protein nucleotidyltransferase chain/domain
MNIHEMKVLREEYRRNHKTLVFTNGCFDLLHAGHVRYLSEAKTLGDVLVVGLNSDESVGRLKGPGRPVNPAADRAEVLAALRSVDHVVVFAEDTAEELVRQLQPDIYVKGGDYSIDRLPESVIVASYGGRTVLVPMVEGRSTSNVIRRLQHPDAAEMNRKRKDIS